MKINKDLEQLVYLFILTNPDVKSDVLFLTWKENRIFKEYNKPRLETLTNWYESIYGELEKKGIRRIN